MRRGSLCFAINSFTFIFEGSFQRRRIFLVDFFSDASSFTSFVSIMFNLFTGFATMFDDVLFDGLLVELMSNGFGIFLADKTTHSSIIRAFNRLNGSGISQILSLFSWIGVLTTTITFIFPSSSI